MLNAVMKPQLHFARQSSGLTIASSEARNEAAEEHERQSLLEIVDEEARIAENQAVSHDDPCPPNPFAHLPVYATIWRIRRDVEKMIKDPYSEDQLRAPRLNTTVVRPYVEQLYEIEDASLVFCLLVNRIQFLRQQVYDAGGRYQSVNMSRALFCEIVAAKIIRLFDEDNPGRKGLLLLAHILIAGFEPFQNAPLELCRVSSTTKLWFTQDRGGYESKMTALEIAIISSSKLFLSVPSCQKVIDAIYVGRVVYTPTSFIDIIPDHYRHRPISIYEPSKASILNQYRLVVPRTRNMIEIGQFILLLALYFAVMTTKRPEHFSLLEGIFCLYTFGWLLDQTATILEHGWHVYSQNLWSFLDVTFGLIYLVYFPVRMRGLATNSIETSQPALNILALAGPLLIPRLAFNVFSESILFVALREMMASFFLLVLLAAWSFAGFLLAMTWLAQGRHSPVTIMKWMIWIWFGLDGTGIQNSSDFHWLLGPILMVAFAFLGNTLFLTLVVSTLSNTFSRIMSHSNTEIQFRRTVLTFEGVKSDAIFAYPPPFNILALLTLLPLKLVLNARWFHKVDITAVRVLNAPLLFAINWYERRNLWPASRGNRAKRKVAHRLWRSSFTRFQVHGDIQAVFESEPPESMAEHQSDSADEEASIQPSSSSTSSGVSPVRAASQAKDRLPSADGPRSRRASKKIMRKDSMYLMNNMEEQVQELLEEYQGDDGIHNRLETLEVSTRRMEEMLRGICKVLDKEATNKDVPEEAGPS